MHPDDIKKYVERLEAWLSREAGRIDERGALDSKDVEFLAKNNFFSLLVPRDYDGLGLSIKELAWIIRRISRYSLAVANIGVVHNSVVSAIVEHGSEELKQSVLSKMAQGALVALSITEPRGGTDIARTITTSIARSNSTCIVNGEKTFTSNALYADYFLVLGKDENCGSKGFTLVLVPKTSSVKVAPLDTMVFRGAGIGRVVFTNAEVEEYMILGEPCKGIELALNIINTGRLLYAVMGLGAAEGLLDKTISTSLAKSIAGKRLIDYQGIQWRIAELYTDIIMLEALLEQLVNENTPSPLKIASAKIKASEIAEKAAWLALQVAGGSGFKPHSYTERMYRDSRALAIGEGANEALLSFIGKGLVKRLS